MFQKVKQSQVVWKSMSVFIKHSVSLEESSAEWNNLHFEAKDEKWALIKDWVFAEAIHIFTGDLQSQEISNLSHWQIFESYSVYFHIWRGADSKVTISEFIHVHVTILVCATWKGKNWNWVTCTTECESSHILIFNWTVIYCYGA